MVVKDKLLYLLVGQDSSAKDVMLERLKKEFLPADLEKFNFDILYARELSLKILQERLLELPVKSKKRLVLIKGAGQIKTDCKEFLLSYCRKPPANIILVLDTDKSDPRDEFINNFARHAQVSRFQEKARLDTFMLSRRITSNQAAEALGILRQLLENGEKPERILGGLRYSCEKESSSLQETKRRMKLLINCDIEIKTGRVKPDFALEKLVVSLSAFRQAPR